MAAKFNLVKRGYEPSEVDAYIETLENVIRSYKEKDKSIKNAILSAQVAADNIVNEAKEHAEEIVANSHSYLEDIKASISEQNTLIDGFKKDYNSLVEKYIVKANEEDFRLLKNRLKTLENYYIKLSKEKEVVSKSETAEKNENQQ